MNDRTTAKLPRTGDVLKEVAAGGDKSRQGGGVKETIESILIAFIFAFMFRAFVVEAFVIPTGSMATTLLGAHMRFACPDCGHDFTVNYSAQGKGDNLYIPPRWIDDKRLVDAKLTCENCGYGVRELGPPIHFGDRILVLKYLYLFQEPARWDVVVFKSPYSPEEYDYTQNYIKRLVGRPGEAVMILDGDVYIGQPGAPREQFQIQTKPRIVQESLWRVVYDNDHHPRGLPRAGLAWQQPWTPRTPDSGWKIEKSPPEGRVIEFDNPDGGGAIFFDRQANPLKQSLSDWLAYDQVSSRSARREVADLKLDLFYERQSGGGPLRLKLSKFDDTFIAELYPDKALLFRRRGDGTQTLIREVTGLSIGDDPTHLELVNVDYQVTLRIDGRDVIQTTPQEYQPNIEALLSLFGSSYYSTNPSAEIEAEKQSGAISHLRLWRDSYYLNDGSIEGTSRPHWASPDNVITLGNDEYFVLGDNSQLSADSRYWPAPIKLPHEALDVGAGKVPGRFLLGKAFFVYWPAGFAPVAGLPAIVPNFGDMRFIH